MCRLLTINCIYGGTIVINSANVQEGESSHSVVQWRIEPLPSGIMTSDKAGDRIVLGNSTTPLAVSSVANITDAMTTVNKQL